MPTALQINNEKKRTNISFVALRLPLTTHQQYGCSLDFQRQVEDIIYENLSDPDFGVKELANKLFMSRSTLHRKLRQQLDTTASDLITLSRLNRAKELLGTRLSLLDIACEIGLSSHSYFNKKFSREFDIKPRDYRNNLQLKLKLT